MSKLEKITRIFKHSLLFQGIISGIYIGILISSFIFMTKYNYLIKTKQVSMLSLYASGILNFTLFGLLFGLISLVFWNLLKMLVRRHHVGRYNKFGFFLSFTIYTSFIFYCLAIINFRKLKGVPWSSNIRITTLITAFILMMAFFPLYLLIMNLIKKLKIDDGIIRIITRRAYFILILLPIVFSSFGIIMGFTRSGSYKNNYLESPIVNGNLESKEFEISKLKKDDLPNIVFIIIETLRSDHLNCYGYKTRVTSSKLDQIFHNGVLFENVYVQSSWTRPSITSIFTSLYPRQHNANENLSQINRSIITLPEILRSLGYQTISFVTSNLAIDDNFGFDYRYDLHKFPPPNPYYISPFSAVPLLKGTAFHRPYRKIFLTPPLDVNYYNDAKKANKYIGEALVDNIKEPFFLYVHYFDPHQPYYSHPYKSLDLNIYSKYTLKSLIKSYDKEIEYVDNALGEMINLLEKRIGLENIIQIVTSDHGEEFFEHGGWGHGKTLYDEVLKVPLIISFPDVLPKRIKIANLIRSIDISPTILDLIGEKIPATFEGRSLIPLIKGVEQDNRTIISELKGSFGWMDCILKDNFKLIKINESFEMFDVSFGKGEKKDISTKFREKRIQLNKELQAYLKKLLLNSYPLEKMKIKKEELEKLKDLGYIR